jgi:putative nucleotidyltransferase with HDIG domain
MVLRIPTRKECDRLIHEMAMLEHIVSHSRLVCRVALLLTDHLLARHARLNRDLVRASALLHDITKTRSFKTKERHAQSGESFLREKGYPEVGKIVGQHVCLDGFSEAAPLTEAEIVNYADKRVLHDQVASLDDRMRYIRDRYCKNAEHREKLGGLWEETLALERKIFSRLPFGPEEIGALIGTKPEP